MRKLLLGKLWKVRKKLLFLTNGVLKASNNRGYLESIT